MTSTTVHPKLRATGVRTGAYGHSLLYTVSGRSFWWIPEEIKLTRSLAQIIPIL